MGLFNWNKFSKSWQIAVWEREIQDIEATIEIAKKNNAFATMNRLCFPQLWFYSNEYWVHLLEEDKKNILQLIEKVKA